MSGSLVIALVVLVVLLGWIMWPLFRSILQGSCEGKANLPHPLDKAEWKLLEDELFLGPEGRPLRTARQ
jgi:hypothetical protein